MCSALPKVLHPLAGQSLLEHIWHTAFTLSACNPPVIVTGFREEEVQSQLNHLPAQWITQLEQRGTGHALLTALPAIPKGQNVLVLYGDVPLISKQTLERLLHETPTDSLGLVTALVPDPSGFGRIVRDAGGKILCIREHRDASPAERAIQEINTGIYLIPESCLHRWLPQLTPRNAQGEYYLTDIIPLALHDKTPICTIQPDDHEEIMGVNTRSDLAHLERYYQRTQAEKLMAEGITLADPARFDLRGTVTAGQDIFIDVNVVLEGKVTLGTGVRIGPGCVLRNVHIGDHTDIRAHCVLDGAEVGPNCIIGPFARLRPGTHLAADNLVGNFVEVKNSRFGRGSKASHLSYIGDSELGTDVNIGAGTITCNYDGASKHTTHIGDRAFIGSHTALVAPLTVHADATVGAGSTLTRDAPAGQLTLTRAPQRTVTGWRRPEKKEKKEKTIPEVT